MQALPLLLQLMLKLVLVLPLPGLIEAEQVGRAGLGHGHHGWSCSEVVPPGPVVRRGDVMVADAEAAVGGGA
ncbi:MAG: hypothetical protein IPG96_13050 [Proteobacteria bacterium]|nr:hypothetical protein [Pseudomonadota bacterium]